MFRTSRPSRWLLAVVAVAGLELGYVALPRASARETAKSEKQATYTFQVYKDKAAEFRWRLVASNGQTIATGGQGYREKRSCVDGIESIKRHAADAKIEDDKTREK